MGACGGRHGAGHLPARRASTTEVNEMTQNTHIHAGDDWPDSALEFSFNPRDPALEGRFAPNEVVIHERGHDIGSRWISGKRDSFVSIDEMR